MLQHLLYAAGVPEYSTPLRGKRNMVPALQQRIHASLWADAVIFLTIQHSTLKGIFNSEVADRATTQGTESGLDRSTTGDFDDSARRVRRVT